MADLVDLLIAVLATFGFYYPLLMAGVWIVGALIYHARWEPPRGENERPPVLPEHPLVSFLVPCRNEAGQVRDTVAWLLAQEYPAIEIVAIDDASTDDTGAILDELAARHAELRVVRFEENQGKAMALRAGALAARSEYLVCIDGDALLDPHATTWMMHHMLTGHRVGAVTGNPRVRNRSTLLGKIQVGEFSAIIGLLKRAQRVYGRIFTATGAASAYRKSALADVGSWSVDMLTEDLDVSWKLQLASWDIRYEPNALCWILMPETFGGLWRQRLRWAQGGVEVLLRHSRDMFQWRRRRMWGIYVEYMTSLAWACSMGFLGLLWFGRFLLELPSLAGLSGVLPEWAGVMLGTACLLQFAVSLWLDGRYERGLGRHYYWMIWYPLVYWAIGMATAVVAIPRTLIGPRRRATWTSPDRGVGAEG